MKRIIFVLLPVLALSGCLSVSPDESHLWLVGYRPEGLAPAKAKYGVTRLIQLVVRSPFDAFPMAVLRADGTVAFDAYNKFPAMPSQLFRGPILDALTASGLFTRVVGPTSSATSDMIVEVAIEKLVLDCSDANARAADVSLAVRLLNAQRHIVCVALGSAKVDAQSGNYGEAFSLALSRALTQAIGKL